MSDFNSLQKQTQTLPMVPKAVAALIIGIGGCVSGLSYGIPGIIMGAIGLVLSKQAQTALYMNPNAYRGEKIIALAKKWSTVALVQGIILTVFFLLYFVFIFSISGAGSDIVDSLYRFFD